MNVDEGHRDPEATPSPSHADPRGLGSDGSEAAVDGDGSEAAVDGDGVSGATTSPPLVDPAGLGNDDSKGTDADERKRDDSLESNADLSAGQAAGGRPESLQDRVSDDETKHLTRWRIIGISISVVATVVLFATSSDRISRAVFLSLYDSVNQQIALAEALGDRALEAEIRAQVAATALNGILVAYLAIAGLVALIGAVMRALSHGATTPAGKALDFTGKVLAFVSAMIGLGAAASRAYEAKIISLDDPSGIVYWSIVGALSVCVVAAIIRAGYLAALPPSERGTFFCRKKKELP